MNFKYTLFVFCMALFAITISCSDDRDYYTPVSGTEPKIQASISMGTRAHDAVWDENDAIGLAMLVHEGKDIINDVFNYHYYTPTSNGDFIAGERTIYFPQNNERVTFRAYYPYMQGLTRDMLIPVSVADQRTPKDFDLMTAEHLSGFSKSDRNVHLRFHHRLSKVIFKFRAGEGEEFLPMDGITLNIKGMQTSATYDLINESLAVNENSMADINIPVRDNSADRYGIVLPRPAGEGVLFEFSSATGDVFKAAMSDTLNLNSGYKYTFYITFEANSVSLSVDIQDWLEGASAYYDIFGINYPAGESHGVNPGDQMAVYMKGDADYALLDTFTYNMNGTWSSRVPIYWEDIPYNPAQIKASMVSADPLNNTQLPDILLTEEINVQRNRGASLVFNHAASKVEVELRSTTFTQEQLDEATIILPGFLTGAHEERAALIPGTQRADILVDRTDKALGVAIFQPQSVSPEAAIVKVTINGRGYTAYTDDSGFLFEPGVAHRLVINLSENAVSLSARVVDWTPGLPSYYEALQVTSSAGETEGVMIGNVMNVYLNENNAYSLLSAFTYNGDGHWAANPEVYWEDINSDPAQMRSSIIASPALNPSQLPDILTSSVINVPQNSGANFVLRHAASKVVVGLLSNTFTDQQLRSATITMPNYLVGGYEQDGAFIGGTSRDDVTVDRTDPVNGIALFLPQSIEAGDPIIRITINGRDYTAHAGDNGFTFEPGVAYTLVVTFNEEAVSVSAKVVDWTTETVGLNANELGITVDGAEGVLDEEQMNVYTSVSADRPLLSTFTYHSGANTWSASPVVYWDDLPSPLTFYGSILRTPKYNDTQLDDYLVAAPVQGTTANGVEFTLSHAVAQVAVELVSTDNTFSADALAAMNITLPNYDMGGSVVNGLFVTGTSTGNITVQKNVGQTGNSALAFIQPQTIAAGTGVVTVTNPSTGRDYTVTYTDDIAFRAGVTTVIRIDMSKTPVTISARVIDWQTGTTINLIPSAIQVGGTLDNTADFFQNKTIHVYKLNDNFQSLTYSYLPTNTGYTWQGDQLYWDDQVQQLSLTGVYYPAQSLIPNIGNNVTVFSWNLPTDQTGGYDDYDLMMDRILLQSPQYVNFVFQHVLSKVRVELTSQEFTAAELSGAIVQLNNVVMTGSASLNSGTVTATTTRSFLNLKTDVDGSSYSGLVMPQTVTQGTQIVTITLRGYPNTPFTGTIQADLVFVPGRENVITLNLRKTEIELSSTLEEWQMGNTGNVVID